MRAGRLLRDVGEWGFLDRLLPRLHGGRGVIVGPGDDCAVVRGAPRMLATTDALVEGVHFERGWQSAAQIGAKAILVNLSDIAAMGGRPQYCLLSVGAPGAFPLRELDRLSEGAREAAAKAGAPIVGGNVSAAAALSVTVTMLGAAPRRPARRDGARPGDHVFVTGTLGDAAVGLRLLRQGVRRGRAAAALIRRFVAPTPRVEVGRRLVEAGLPSAMIDVSDGLVQDLGHICERSRVGAILIEAHLPRSRAYAAVVGDDAAFALGGGEDYELLFCVPSRRVPRLDMLRSRLCCPVTRVGTIFAGRGVRVEDRHGRLIAPRRGGHEHFRLEPPRARAVPARRPRTGA